MSSCRKDTLWADINAYEKIWNLLQKVLVKVKVLIVKILFQMPWKRNKTITTKMFKKLYI